MNRQSSLPVTRYVKSKRPIPDWIWAPLVSGGLMLLVGTLGLIAHQPWLFPSLGPTAFLQAEQPDVPFAKFYNTVIGHAIGVCTGLLAIFVFGANSAPAVLGTGEITAPRVVAAVLAGCDLDMILLKRDRKTILVEFIPKLAPTRGS